MRSPNEIVTASNAWSPAKGRLQGVAGHEPHLAGLCPGRRAGRRAGRAGPACRARRSLRAPTWSMPEGEVARDRTRRRRCSQSGRRGSPVPGREVQDQLRRRPGRHRTASTARRHQPVLAQRQHVVHQVVAAGERPCRTSPTPRRAACPGSRASWPQPGTAAPAAGHRRPAHRGAGAPQAGAPQAGPPRDWLTAGLGRCHGSPSTWRATNAITVSFQTWAWWGDSTQWFSSGK